MVLCLILHSSHHQEPEDIFLSVISAGDDLVVDVGNIRLLRVGLLPLMVADQHKGRVEPWNELGNHPVEQIMMPVNQARVIEA